MKHQPTILFLFISIAFFSCKKEEPTDETPVSFLDTLSLPATFKQNVLFEVFTGTWCQYCPKADCQIDDLMEVYPERMFAVALHYNDVLDMENDSVKKHFGVNSFPSKTFNYCDFFYSTSSKYASYLNQPAKFGLALTTQVENDSATVQVLVGFKESANKNLKLAVYLTEDGLIASQKSDYDDDPTSCYYNRGSTIYNYVHDNVLRHSVSSSILGDFIASSEAVGGNKIIRSYRFALDPKWNKENLKITAFVTDGNVVATSSSGYHKYFNANQVLLGNTAAWN